MDLEKVRGRGGRQGMDLEKVRGRGGEGGRAWIWRR